MVSLKILFGFVPKTAEYEAAMDALRKEYQEFVAFNESKELTDYIDLEKNILSSDFALKKKQIQQQKFADTPEFRLEKEYLTLKKSKGIKLFYAAKNSLELKEFKATEISDQLARYYQLEKFVQSPEFLNVKSEYKKKKKEGLRFQDTEEYRKFIEFEQLKKSDKIRNFFSYLKSKIYRNFKNYEGSEAVTRYEELEKTVSSEAFRKVKEYMLLPGKKKYEISDEYKLEQEYLKCKNSEKFKWYFKVRDSHRFDEVKRWNLSFAEDFSSGIDSKKWITRYFWGDKVLKDSYALADEKHLFTSGKNLEVANGRLKIITKKEKIQGKVWNPSMGFFPREFNYTSGIISTGDCFRQKYGLFEAKIRINRSYPVHHAFWMVSEKMLPHIDIVKYNSKINFGNYWATDGNKFGKKIASAGAGKYTSDFFIYSLEWTQQHLIWKINGVPVITSTDGIPEAPMYLNLSSGLYTETGGGVLPASMEVDWVRCYQHA